MMNWSHYFASPAWLWLLLLVIPMGVWYVLKEKKSQVHLQISTTLPFQGQAPGWRVWGRHGLFVIRILSVILLVVIMARPQSTDRWENVSTEGIDIMLALDVSSSMLAQDFSPDRLEAAKDVASEFISGRPYDRIGLVIFSAESFTQCPLTTDHSTVINQLHATRSGVLDDGTAIGLGLATAINRLKESQAKSRVIILLTDGVNNTGNIDPGTAAEIASTMGLRVYTIGVGTTGQARTPVQTPAGIVYRYVEVNIDEEVLQKVASATGGRYFRAISNETLREVYKEIDQLEKSKIEVSEMNRKQEEYMWFAWLAAGLILLEQLLRNTVFRKFP